MFNDDFFDDELFDIENLINEFQKVKQGEAHRLLTEDDFECLIDYFEANGDRENASLACEIATTLYPFSSTLLLRKAEWLTDQKKYGQALRILDQLDEVDPNNIESIFLQSDIYLEQNRFAEAVDILERNVDQFDSVDKTDILLELSEIYDELEEFDKVYATLKRILTYEPNNEDALLRICFWAEINNKHEDSIALHQEIIDRTPFNAMAWYNLGVAYQGIKLYEKAIDAYEYCLAIDDKFEYAYRNQGDAYMQLKKYDKAIEVLEMHLSIAKPEDVILDAIGYCWDKQKEYSKARHYYRKASQLNPQDDQIFYKIGETYSKELQWEKAIKAYSVALHINKNNASYCLALGNCLMEMKAEKEAMICYLNAVQLRPDIKSTWQALIKALYTVQYYSEALSQLSIAEDHCGFKTEFVYYRAAILLAKGKTKEAVIQLEQALAENPKKLASLKYIDAEIMHHPVFAEVIIRNKKKK
ncbi:MAG TPA: tetratricopeptide repeat protein [Chitinophagaceae bacterium]|nr:tetratricopeptide repeat protein [Chitinophagaceae bacterium]HNF70934.1 tetratricopeptide repeat protein [Chitinophagaceae bacterium]